MAGKNPFPSVPDPADEPPFEPDEPNQVGEGAPGDVRVSDVYPTGEVGLSFKFGTGYEAPMLHFKAASLEGLADLVGYERGAESGVDLFFGLTEYAANGSKFVTGKYTEITGRKIVSSGGGGGERKGTPAEANQPPSWMGSPPDCAHGPRKYVSRVKQDGSRWHAWGCSGPQGDNCEPGLQFVNAPKAK